MGAMLVPLNFRLAPAEWDAVLADCAPRMRAARRSLGRTRHRRWRSATAGGHPVQALDERGRRTRCARSPVTPLRPVLLVYTSGTTGAPQGAVHTQASLMANMAHCGGQVQA
jgi:fatty-acyl-CoA synthase